MSSANIKSKSVNIENIKTGEIFQFVSLRKAAQFIKTTHSQAIIYIKNGKHYNNIYKIYL